MNIVDVFYPLLAAAGTGMVGIGLAKAEQLLHIQASAVANTAIQNAVGNFAGKVAADVAAGRITMEQVRTGAALPALAKYAAETVSESMDRAGVTPATLQTMLVGKVAPLVAATAGAGVLQEVAMQDNGKGV